VGSIHQIVGLRFRSHASFRSILHRPVARANDARRAMRGVWGREMEPVSVLFDALADETLVASAVQPEYFVDLNLDQIVDAVTAGKEEYDLKPYFNSSLRDASAVRYRHAVMQDLEQAGVLSCVRDFAARMRKVRACVHTADELFYVWQKRRWLLDAVHLYGDAVRELAAKLEVVSLSSLGLQRFRDYLQRYILSDAFASLVRHESDIRRALGEVRYNIHIHGDSVVVTRYDGESDYSAEVLRTFEKFKQRDVGEHHGDVKDYPSMNHVEARILDCVVQLNPALFQTLAAFCDEHAGFVDSTVGRFDREIQFYVSYLEHMRRIAEQQVAFCYPAVSAESKRESAIAAFDLALAEKLRRERQCVVTNDYWLDGAERIIVITGPNQGGKTTFARTFGQLHHLASLGLPVPGAEARLLLFDRLFTHFEREEDMKNLRGKLHDDLFRIHRILGQATPRSIIVMNEIFSSTSLQDAVFLSRKIIARIIELDALAIYVTFIEELSRLAPQTISMLSEIGGDGGTTRTFRVRRQPADGRSYAVSLAYRYRLTDDQLRERLKL
jgi:DNA mismatch repair protein MutS